MLALENAFDIEIPDQMLTRQLFRSVESLAAAVEVIRQQQEAA
jgi:acyl carrier protein